MLPIKISSLACQVMANYITYRIIKISLTYIVNCLDFSSIQNITFKVLVISIALHL